MLDFKVQLMDVGKTTLPISALIIGLYSMFLDPSASEFAVALLCCAFVIMGFSLFLYGVDIGVIPMGIAIGSEMPKRKSMFFMIVMLFIIGMTVTLAEPDVSVFSNTVSEVYSSVQFWPLMLAISMGVGAFLVIAALKIVFDISLRILLTVGYIIVIILALIVPETFVGIAFDAGGVTTGAMTLPVILAMGMGICMIISTRSSMSGFGMVGLASIGPIIFVLSYGLLIGPIDATSTAQTIDSTLSIAKTAHELLSCTFQVAIAICPLYLIFLVFQRYFLHYSWRDFRIMSIGIGIASFGMILFLTGVYAGFMPLAGKLGQYLANNGDSILIMVLGLVIGLLVVMSEPAIKILSKQIESASNGEFSARLITAVIAIGVSTFVGTGLYLLSIGLMSMYYLLPIYAIAIILTWVIDKDLMGITYDAGGVAAGPMSVAIIMTIYASIASVVYPGASGTVHAFGAIALIAVAPIISLSLLGVIIRYKKGKKEADGPGKDINSL